MKTITILSGRAMIVELPEGASDTTYPKIGIADLYFQKEGKHIPEESYISVPIPEGNWQIVGRLSEITEEQAEQLVEPNGNGDYRNYEGAWGGFATAIQSLESAIRAEGWMFENPYGETEPAPLLIDSEEEHRKFILDKLRWMAAQSRVLDKSRCLLLRRVDG